MSWMKSQCLLHALTLMSTTFLHQDPFSTTQLPFCPLANGKLWICLENAAIVLLENLVTLLEQTQNKHLLTLIRQLFFFLFFHFKVTNEERGMQRTLCRTVGRILPTSCCTTCKVCDHSTLLGLHFPSSAGLWPTDQLRSRCFQLITRMLLRNSVFLAAWDSVLRRGCGAYMYYPHRCATGLSAWRLIC